MGAQVLLVEDNPQNLELMSYLLQAHGHEVIATDDGSTAVALASEVVPDLIAMDISLVGQVDGFEALRRIRTTRRLRDIPVVAVTAYAMVGDRERALSAGFTDYLTKPIDPSTFVQTITRHLPEELQTAVAPAMPASAGEVGAGPAEPAAELTVPESLDRTATILVVDDKEVNIELLRSILGVAGHRVLAAGNITDALVLIRASRPDLVLSDMHLGTEDGLSLLAAVRADAEIDRTPLAFVSATSEPSQLPPNLEPVSFLFRPIEPQVLLDRVAQLLRHPAG